MRFARPFRETQSDRLPDGIFLLPRKPVETDFGNVPRFYLANSRWLTLVMDTFALVVPEHERFFVETVLVHMEEGGEHEKKDALRAFVRQESIHLAIYDQYNDSRVAFGIDVERERTRIQWAFDLVRQRLPYRIRLGMTVFMEHATAAAAHFAVQENGLLRFFHPTMAQLWQWHAIEEIEHKSVAFDAFQQSGGGYVSRIISALLVVLLDVYLIAATANALRIDMKAFDKSRDIDERSRMDRDQRGFASHAASEIQKKLPRAVWILMRYFKPGFDPWDLDESKEVRRLYEFYN
jgi:uncharacterized protein